MRPSNNLNFSENRSNIYDRAVQFLALLAFAYTFIRASILSITHDEALTYLISASTSFRDILAYNLPAMSNCHLLNSVLIKLLTGILDVSELTIRIPALIGHVLYLAGIYNILKFFLKKTRLIFGMVLLLFNPFMLDFFSCARGYALGLGFMSLGLLFLFRRIKESRYAKDIKNTSLAIALLTISVFSNISFFNVFLSVATVFMFLEVSESISVIKNRQSALLFLKQFLKCFLPLAPGILLLWVAYAQPIIKMSKGQEFYYGGTEGFWQNTVKSLAEVTLYGRVYPRLFIGIELLIAGVIIIALAALVYKLAVKSQFNLIDKYLSCILAILFISALSIGLQHILFNTKYVIERTAIYFIPLFYLLVLILWRKADSIKLSPARNILNIFFYLIVSASLLNFVTSVNFGHFLSWKYDASTKKMMNYLTQINKGKNPQDGSVSLGIDWVFEPSINFYRKVNNLAWLKAVDRGGPDNKFDYYYLLLDSKGLMEKYHLTVLKKFDTSDTYLSR